MDEAEKLPHCLPVKRCDDYDVAKAKAGDFSEMTAEQYLSFVRDQADNMPVVARADIDITQFEGRQTKYMPEISSILPCDEDLLPLSDWEQSVLNDFENLRAVSHALLPFPPCRHTGYTLAFSFSGCISSFYPSISYVCFGW